MAAPRPAGGRRRQPGRRPARARPTTDPHSDRARTRCGPGGCGCSRSPGLRRARGPRHHRRRRPVGRYRDGTASALARVVEGTRGGHLLVAQVVVLALLAQHALRMRASSSYRTAPTPAPSPGSSSARSRSWRRCAGTPRRWTGAPPGCHGRRRHVACACCGSAPCPRSWSRCCPRGVASPSRGTPVGVLPAGRRQRPAPRRDRALHRGSGGPTTRRPCCPPGTAEPCWPRPCCWPCCGARPGQQRPPPPGRAGDEPVGWSSSRPASAPWPWRSPPCSPRACPRRSAPARAGHHPAAGHGRRARRPRRERRRPRRTGRAPTRSRSSRPAGCGPSRRRSRRSGCGWPAVPSCA